MRIGIDIDDTTTNHCEQWFSVYNRCERTGEDPEIRLSDADRWDFYDAYGKATKDRLFAALRRQDAYYDGLKLLPGAAETLTALHEAGHQVLLLSATAPEYQERKRWWMIEHLPFLQSEDVIFTEHKQAVPVSVMVDDRLQYASAFRCPFLLRRRPWNEDQEPSLYTDNIIPCDDWRGIDACFRRLGLIS